jgi:hypothetical protein
LDFKAILAQFGWLSLRAVDQMLLF